MTNHLPEHMYLMGEQEAELREAMKPERRPRFTFSVASEIAVIGRNPEFADLDNREGNIFGERWFMVAADPFGRLYRYGWEKSESLAEAVFEHIAPPVAEWPFWRCEYGSKAYQEEGCELDQLRQEMEEDLGPNWRSGVDPAVSMMIPF